jgi:hypothetical protein
MKKGGPMLFFIILILQRDCGTVEVIKEAFIDKTDKEKIFVAVQVRFREQLKYPVHLKRLKN